MPTGPRTAILTMSSPGGGGGGTPGGADTQVQYNDGGAFGGDAGLTFNETTDVLTVEGGVDIDSDAGLFRLGESQDVVLARDAADVLAQRRGTNAQTFRVYNTFTDSSNYERTIFGYNAGLSKYEIGEEHAGTGVKHPVRLLGERFEFVVDGTHNFTLSATNFNPVNGTAKDLGEDLGFGAPNSWRDLYLNRDYLQHGGNDQRLRIRYLTELTTIAAAAFTDTTIQAPANSLVVGVSVRVTVVIPTAATFDIGVAGATTRYGTGVSVAANTTNASPGTTNPSIYAAATSIRLTPDLSPAANTGRVRVTIHYIDMQVPSS